MTKFRSPENYPKVAWYDVAFLMFDLVCSISSVITGAFFATASEGNSCKLGIPLYFILGGAGNLSLSTFRFLFPVAGSLLQLQFNLGMIVYGSILAFGNSKTVDLNNPSSPYFCHELPFRSALFSIVALILYFGAGVLFYLFCCLYIYFCQGRGAKDTWAYKYSSGYLYSSIFFLARIARVLVPGGEKKEGEMGGGSDDGWEVSKRPVLSMAEEKEEESQRRQRKRRRRWRRPRRQRATTTATTTTPSSLSLSSFSALSSARRLMPPVFKYRYRKGSSSRRRK